MLAYIYDELNKGFLFSETVMEDPMNPGEYLLPVSSTLVEPPVYGAYQLPQWNGKKWNIVEDHRQVMLDDGSLTGGTPYWLPGDTYETPARYVTELGPLPATAMKVQPEKPLSAYKEEKIIKINMETTQSIESGFVYKGYTYHYDLYTQQNFSDYANLASSAIATGTTKIFKIMSYRPDGTRVEQTYTAPEFLELYAAATSFKDDCIEKGRVRVEKAQAATSVEELSKI